MSPGPKALSLLSFCATSDSCASARESLARVFIATPNRWFPIELHTQIPFWHWLPKPQGRRIFRAGGLERGASMDAIDVELTILMPCLNEAETIATCINKARKFLDRTGVSGEVLVADNGSTDGSQQIAQSLGARV